MNFKTIAAKLDPQGRADLAAFHEVRDRIFSACVQTPQFENISGDLLKEYRRCAMQAANHAGFPVVRNLVNDWATFRQMKLANCQAVAEQCWLDLMVEATSTAPKVVQGTLRLMKRNEMLAPLRETAMTTLGKTERPEPT